MNPTQQAADALAEAVRKIVQRGPESSGFSLRDYQSLESKLEAHEASKAAQPAAPHDEAWIEAAVLELDHKVASGMVREFRLKRAAEIIRKHAPAQPCNSPRSLPERGEALSATKGHEDCNADCNECDWTFDCFSGIGACRKGQLARKRAQEERELAALAKAAQPANSQTEGLNQAARSKSL